MEDKVLETVVNGLEYTPLQDILVKPLAPIMLKKEVTEAVGTGEKDVDGYESADYCKSGYRHQSGEPVSYLQLGLIQTLLSSSLKQEILLYLIRNLLKTLIYSKIVCQ